MSRQLLFTNPGDSADRIAEARPVSRMTGVGQTLIGTFGNVWYYRRDMEGSFRRPRVLVVDDDEAIRSFAQVVLIRAGYDVTTAPDGERALELVQDRSRFDVFVVDLHMPRLSGDELGRRLRVGDPDVKVLYFTGDADQLFENRSVLWEHEAFLQKPVTVKALEQAVSMMLFGHLEGPRLP